MTDAAIHFYPGHGEFLQYGWPEPGDEPVPERRILEVALEVFDAFCPVILEPLVAVMDLTGVDEWGAPLHPEVKPENAARLLQAPLPPWVNLGDRFSEYSRREVPALTRQVLRDWMEEASRLPPPDGAQQVAWSSLVFPAARARVFEPERFAGKEVLELDSELRTLTVPVERDARGMWLSGPLERLPRQPPIELSISRPHGGLFVNVIIHWTPWSQEGSPGSKAIDAALAHLVTRGWERESEE